MLQGEPAKKIDARLNAYLDENWEDMVGDIATLVRIPSVLEGGEAKPGMPFGPGPRHALDAALDMAACMGFQTYDVDGYLGFADFPGASGTQVGIIGHVDVVPAGPGWTFEPYDVARKEGYLVGRGVIDDKGPVVVALHALKFWKDLQDAGQAPAFPYTVRFLFGANEETGMGDVAYYRQRYDDPAFLFTPDAEFPVSYGEKGIFNGLLSSRPLSQDDRAIVRFEGGVAVNAVPGLAEAVVRADAERLPATDRIAVDKAGSGLARLSAIGKSAHASVPEDGVNAIGLIVDYLLGHDLCTPDERAFLELDRKLLCCTDGSGLGIRASDEHFGGLTAVGGTIGIEDGCLVQSLDVRFPTSIAAGEITRRVDRLARQAGCSFKETMAKEPFLMQPDSPVIQALLNAYNEATGEDAQPFTMGGGTYAREFTSAASFGPERPWEESPAWAGGMHGPDEAASEESLKQAFKIYALTIQKLMELEL